MKPFEPEKQEKEEDVRKGPWTLDEDDLLIEYIARHGEGRWNSLAKSSGLRRTGKSCRLRWLNYLKPDIKRGNLTTQEQLKILELHAKWGNRWSKIAQSLPGRTDNEIKNYWRTKVQKQARQLNMESNGQGFIDTVRCFYVPRLVQKIEQNSFSSTATDPAVVQYDQSFKDYSSSSSSPPSCYSSESSKRLNPVECSGYSSNACTNEDVTQCRDNSALPLENWYYVDKSICNMAELPSMSAAHMADQSWISSDTWNLDGLW